jgi:hypothetical protein
MSGAVASVRQALSVPPDKPLMMSLQNLDR